MLLGLILVTACNINANPFTEKIDIAYIKHPELTWQKRYLHRRQNKKKSEKATDPVNQKIKTHKKRPAHTNAHPDWVLQVIRGL